MLSPPQVLTSPNGERTRISPGRNPSPNSRRVSPELDMVYDMRRLPPLESSPRTADHLSPPPPPPHVTNKRDSKDIRPPETPIIPHSPDPSSPSPTNRPASPDIQAQTAAIAAQLRVLSSHKRFVLHPATNSFLHVWDLISAAALIYTATVTPFEACFIAPTLGPAAWQDQWFLLNRAPARTGAPPPAALVAAHTQLLARRL